MKAVGDQFQLFNTKRYSAKADYSPDAYSATSKWHASDEPVLPQQGESAPARRDPPNLINLWNAWNPHPLGFHNGSIEQAVAQGPEKYYHPVTHTGEYTQRTGTGVTSYGRYRNTSGWREIAKRPAKTKSWEENDAHGFDAQSTDMVEQGYHVPYINWYEEKGAQSFRSPREKLNTWADDVLSDENAPRRYRDLAQSGHNLVYQRKNFSSQGEQLSLLDDEPMAPLPATPPPNAAHTERMSSLQPVWHRGERR